MDMYINTEKASVHLSIHSTIMYNYKKIIFI